MTTGAGRAVVEYDGDSGRSEKKYVELGERFPPVRRLCISAISVAVKPACASEVAHEGGMPVNLLCTTFR